MDQRKVAELRKHQELKSSSVRICITNSCKMQDLKISCNCSMTASQFLNRLANHFQFHRQYLEKVWIPLLFPMI